MLVVWMSEDMTWKHHVEDVEGSIQSLLSQVDEEMWYPKKEIFTFYNSVIRILLECDCPAWHISLLTQQDNDLLEHIQLSVISYIPKYTVC